MILPCMQGWRKFTAAVLVAAFAAFCFGMGMDTEKVEVVVRGLLYYIVGQAGHDISQVIAQRKSTKIQKTP